MPKCSFSGESIPKGTGTMYVLKDGKILWFKNSKSMKNYLKLKRKPLKVRWTEAYRTEHRKGVK
jgi:ribosomal protein L24E